MLWNPNQIQIPSHRQRTQIDTDEILESIQTHGQLAPIIVRHDEDCEKSRTFKFEDGEEFQALNPCICKTPILIAGERRLESCKTLNIQVEIKFRENLTPLEAEKLEYEENARRKPLSWRDEIKWIVKIHNLLLTSNPSNLPKDTAKEIGINIPLVHNALLVFPHLSSPLLSDAQNIHQATEIVKSFFKDKVKTLTDNFNLKAKELLSNPIPDSLKIRPNSFLKPTPLKLKLDIPSAEETLTETDAEPVKNISFTTYLKNNPDARFDVLHLDFRKLPESEIAFYLQSNLIQSCKSGLIWFNNTQELIKSNLSYFSFLLPPLIWYQSDEKKSYYSYESALIFYKPETSVYLKPNLFPHPDSNLIPKSVLEYFLSFLIVPNLSLSFFDPFAQLGTSLSVAKHLGAKSIFGLETNEKFYQEANNRLLKRKE